VYSVLVAVGFPKSLEAGQQSLFPATVSVSTGVPSTTVRPRLARLTLPAGLGLGWRTPAPAFVFLSVPLRSQGREIVKPTNLKFCTAFDGTLAS
jgi:hypothetical protein